MANSLEWMASEYIDAWGRVFVPRSPNDIAREGDLFLRRTGLKSWAVSTQYVSPECAELKKPANDWDVWHPCAPAEVVPKPRKIKHRVRVEPLPLP